MKITIDTDKIETYSKLMVCTGKFDQSGEDGLFETLNNAVAPDGIDLLKQEVADSYDDEYCVCLIIPVFVKPKKRKPEWKQLNVKTDLGIK